MYTENTDNTCYQKGIRKVLEKRNFWPTKGLKLSCSSPKCLDCQLAAKYKLCVKKTRCEGCKNPKEYNGIAKYTSQRKYDVCILRQI